MINFKQKSPKILFLNGWGNNKGGIFEREFVRACPYKVDVFDWFPLIGSTSLSDLIKKVPKGYDIIVGFSFGGWIADKLDAKVKRVLVCPPLGLGKKEADF